MCKASELAELQLKTLTEENKIEVIKQNKIPPLEGKSLPHKKKYHVKQKQQGTKSSSNYQGNTYNEPKPCRKCGTFHRLYNCPAYCMYCKKKNHFSKVCTYKNVNAIQNNLEHEFHNNGNEYILGSAEDKNLFSKNRAEWFERLKVSISKYLLVKLDTGAQCNVLPLPKFKQLNLRDKCLTKSKVTFNNYNGTTIDVVGKCKLLCETSKGDKDEVQSQVVACDKTVPAILGLPTLQKLNLVQRICTVNPDSNEKLPESFKVYQDLFKGTGNLTGYTYYIKLKPGAVSKIEPCRKIPLSLLNPLKRNWQEWKKMYYDIKLPVVLSVDASQEGLGAVLLQNNLPVAYAFKALTDTQKNYAQIEKETLAIVFACEKFHQYIFGKYITAECDHKPLESIFKKPLNKCPVSLQRMRIRLQPYQFEIKYKPGKELFTADALSRSFTDKGSDFFEGDIERPVELVVECIPMSKDKMEIFQLEA
ncbi:Retrovirus-related Pol polyprotein from transposon 297, partial [Stegodyphus mimosarum]